MYIYIYIAGCSLESKLKNVSVGLDVDFAKFSRQATAGTSDDIDHRRIYASPELNSHIAPLFDSRKISLCICIYLMQCHSHVWFYMYICSILFLEIPLCSYHSSYELSLSVCFMYLYLTIVVLRIYSPMY